MSLAVSVLPRRDLALGPTLCARLRPSVHTRQVRCGGAAGMAVEPSVGDEFDTVLDEEPEQRVGPHPRCLDPAQRRHQNTEHRDHGRDQLGPDDRGQQNRGRAALVALAPRPRSVPAASCQARLMPAQVGPSATVRWLAPPRFRHHGDSFAIQSLAAWTCPAGKCLISADTKCEVRCSAISPSAESVTRAAFLTCF